MSTNLARAVRPPLSIILIVAFAMRYVVRPMASSRGIHTLVQGGAAALHSNSVLRALPVGQTTSNMRRTLAFVMSSTSSSPRLRRRRVTTIVVAAAFAALTLPGLASAAAPIQTSDLAHSTGGRITTADGTIEFSISSSTLSGARGFINYSGPLGSMFGPEGFAEMIGNRLTGEFFLIDGETNEPAGFATYVIDFTVAGPETATHDVIKDGNHRTVLDLVQQPMLANGAITLPDGTVFPVVDLPATRFVVDTWSNDPAATILDGSETFIEANWMLDGLPLTFRLHVTELDSAAVVFLQLPTGGEIIGTARPTFVDDTLSTEFTLTQTGGTVVGDAAVGLQVTELGSTAAFEETDISRQRVITTDIAIRGELTVKLDGVTHTFDFAEADLFSVRHSWHGIQYPHAEGGEG
jgi:hypothetical protein